MENEYNPIIPYNIVDPVKISDYKKFSIALKKGDIKEVNSLLSEKKVMIAYMVDQKGQTPLHFAVKQNNIFMAACLIQHASPINAKDHQGYAPLHLAILNNKVSMVADLLKKGASIDILVKNQMLFEIGILSLHNKENRDIPASIFILELLIREGVRTYRHNYDLMDTIDEKYKNHKKNLKHYRDILQLHIKIRCFTTNNNETLCYQLVYARMRAWTDALITPHIIFQREISRLPIREESILGIIALEVQFKFLKYLQDSLNSNCDIHSVEHYRFALFSKKLQRFRHQVIELHQILEKGYKTLSAPRELSEDKRKLALELLFSSQSINSKTRLELFIHLKYSSELHTQELFFQKWLSIIAEYIKKTLPKNLQSYFKPFYIQKAATQLGIDSFLKDLWLHKKEFGKTPELQEKEHALNVHLSAYRCFGFHIPSDKALKPHRNTKNTSHLNKRYPTIDGKAL